MTTEFTQGATVANESHTLVSPGSIPGPAPIDEKRRWILKAARYRALAESKYNEAVACQFARLLAEEIGDADAVEREEKFISDYRKLGDGYKAMKDEAIEEMLKLEAQEAVKS